MSNNTVLSSNLEKYEILVVDDIPANLEVIIETLSSAQYNVSAVTSGKRALKQLQRNAPSLILLDIQMPEMDGFETCQHIKSNPETANIPIIFITALSDTESVVKGFSLGAVDYLTKPFREAELLARVQTHLTLHLLTEQLEEQVNHRTAELECALEEVHESKLQLIQQEKMSALGNLVAGVAHEVNNPVGFLNGSISNTKEYLQDFLDYLELYQQQHPPVSPALQEKAEEIDLDFLLDDFPKMLNSMQYACDRISKITTHLRTFARTDTYQKNRANLNDCLDSTLLLLKYRLKKTSHRSAIQVIKRYSTLPGIDCFPNQINQVFMNILANAIDVFDEAAQQMPQESNAIMAPTITIQTEYLPEQNSIQTQIHDNGKGMEPGVKAQIFEHLFTTKQVGKGTGLGLAIANQIITEKHGGAIACDSELGKGTTFIITLPVNA
ncbi:MAG: response regulator [Cyanobacteria bacterium P01_F01_bin.150]